MAFQMNDMTKPVKDRLGFDPASVKKLTFGELVKKIGPGIILTGIVIGPGNITTSAMMGANYGYKMLWLLIPIILMGITFTLSSYRISIMTGLPILTPSGIITAALPRASAALLCSCPVSSSRSATSRAQAQA